MIRTITLTEWEVDALHGLLSRQTDATTTTEDHVIKSIVERARPDTLTIRRPRWMGGDPVTARQVREALTWLADKNEPNGLTGIPVFHTLRLVKDALDEKEKA